MAFSFFQNKKYISYVVKATHCEVDYLRHDGSFLASCLCSNTDAWFGTILPVSTAGTGSIGRGMWMYYNKSPQSAFLMVLSVCLLMKSILLGLKKCRDSSHVAPLLTFSHGLAPVCLLFCFIAGAFSLLECWAQEGESERRESLRLWHDGDKCAGVKKTKLRCCRNEWEGVVCVFHKIHSSWFFVYSWRTRRDRCKTLIVLPSLVEGPVDQTLCVGAEFLRWAQSSLSHSLCSVCRCNCSDTLKVWRLEKLIVTVNVAIK